MRPWLSLGGVVALVALSNAVAHADDITLIAPGGIRAAFQELIPEFEHTAGHKVVATYGSGGATRDRVVNGEAFDVPIVQPPYEKVLASGNVIPSSEALLASVAVGLAVRAGAAKPNISSPEALKQALLGAHAIAYPDPAAGAGAGVSIAATLEKLGIAEALRSKFVPARTGADAMARVAKGEVDIGLTFMSEMTTEPDIELVGALPREVSPPTAFVAFVSSHAKEPEAARALVNFLSAPAAARIYRAHGMEPGR